MILEWLTEECLLGFQDDLVGASAERIAESDDLHEAVRASTARHLLLLFKWFLDVF